MHAQRINKKKKMSEREVNPMIMKRMQSDICYRCGKLGHWSWFCPLNPPNNNNNNQTSLSFSPNHNDHYPLSSNLSIVPLQQTSLDEFLEGCSQSNITDNTDNSQNLSPVAVSDIQKGKNVGLTNEQKIYMLSLSEL